MIGKRLTYNVKEKKQKMLYTISQLYEKYTYIKKKRKGYHPDTEYLYCHPCCGLESGVTP